MNIFYSDNTLFINMDEDINEYSINRLKTRVFKIVRDYDIENVVLSTSGYKKSNYLIKNFLEEYESTFNGHIKLK